MVGRQTRLGRTIPVQVNSPYPEITFDPTVYQPGKAEEWPERKERQNLLGYDATSGTSQFTERVLRQLGTLH